jgi:beta-phosphoglucomutase
MTVHAVLFDFDGVIADTEALHLRAFQRVVEPKGVAIDVADYYERYLGYSDRDMLQALRRDRGLTWSARDLDALLAAKGDAFARVMGTGGVLYPAARACIERLASRRSLAIASGAYREEIAFALAGAGLAHCFQAIVGAGDVARSKPHPDPYLEAARQVGIAPGLCVAIEDSMWGLESARRAGCRTIALTHTYPRHQLVADAIVDSLDEITEELLGRV